jgi:iron(III) transport system ATP-binding protein
VGELRCSGIAVSYGARSVLSGVDLVVPRGTLTAVLGASGSGKTTLLRVIAGFLSADCGTVSVGDTVLADGRVHVAAERRGIGYVPQDGALFPHLTVGANVAFGLDRRQRKHTASIAEVLELVGLDESYAARRPQELSGGEQRRVALARALAPRPGLVLLDEPFSGLDASLRAETREVVRDALVEQRTTAVLVTHEQGEALSMGREVCVLRDGLLVQCSDPVTLYRTPTDLDVARFVGDAVVLTGTVGGGAVSCALGRLALVRPVAPGPVSAMIRPEQIRLVRTGTSEGHAGAEGTVLGHTYHGPDTMLRVELHGAGGVTITARIFGDAAPAIGSRVSLAVVGAVVAYPITPDPTRG